MSFLSSIFGEDEKKSSLLIDEETKRPLITSISSKTVEPNEIKYWKLFDLPENKGKSLQIHDLAGSWIVSENGTYLKRMHSKPNLPEIESYYWLGDGCCRKYFMTNGHTFVFNYENRKFTIGDGIFCTCSFDKYEWI